MPHLFLERLEARQLFSASPQLIEVEDAYRQLLQQVRYVPAEIAVLQKSFLRDENTVAAALAPLKKSPAATKAINASIAAFRHGQAAVLAGLTATVRDLATSTTRLSSEFVPLAVKWSENKLTPANKERLTLLSVSLSGFLGNEPLLQSGDQNSFANGVDSILQSLPSATAALSSPTIQAAAADNAASVENFQYTSMNLPSFAFDLASTVTA